MSNIKVLIDGKELLNEQLEHVEPEQIIKTIKMILDYAKLHKGSKIKMLRGLQRLR